MSDINPLPVGTKAPDFSLPIDKEKQVSLADYLGKPVVLVFYPADWSSVCSDQLSLYNELLEIFNKHQAQVLGISVDGLWCHQAFSQDRQLKFPLLSDFHPKGEVARKYGVYLDELGENARALFVVDTQGIIRYSYVSPSSVNPGAEGILQALEEISS